MLEEGSALPSFVLRAVRFARGRLAVIDQTRLPGRVRRIRLRSAAEAAKAIERLVVRGAPNIGVAAAYGLAVEAGRLPDTRLGPGLRRAAAVLKSARPTAVNLAWAVERVLGTLDAGLGPGTMRRKVTAEARRIEQEETERSFAMARHGAALVRPDAKVVTICNTGALAAPGIGTALGVVFQAHIDGKRPHVFACETRPLLQGARLTALELTRAGIDCTLIVDSAAATVMPECDLVLVGADRIAVNGDFANKVGTKMLAILARAYRRPFYVVAPSSTFDLRCASGDGIVVEERPAGEVTAFAGRRVAPGGVGVFNPAFDLTPAGLVTSFITERGIIRPPYRRNVSRTLGGE